MSLQAAAPEHRGKYARMPRKQIRRPTENSPSLFPSTALCSPNPRVHATLAVCLASATATAAASGSSSSSNLKPREGASAAVASPPAAVAAALPLFSLWKEERRGGNSDQGRRLRDLQRKIHATHPPAAPAAAVAGPTSNRGNAFRLASFYCRRGSSSRFGGRRTDRARIARGRRRRRRRRRGGRGPYIKDVGTEGEGGPRADIIREVAMDQYCKSSPNAKRGVKNPGRL